jgi:hypothetical protein
MATAPSTTSPATIHRLLNLTTAPLPQNVNVRAIDLSLWG